MRKGLHRRRWPLLLLAMTGILLIAGCGTKMATVEGVVTWDAKPVESGTISFAPADATGPTIGGEIKDGKYLLEGKAGVTPGKKTVSITAMRKTGKQIEAGPPAPPGTMVDDLERISDTKSCEITDGTANHQDFSLEPPAK